MKLKVKGNPDLSYSSLSSKSMNSFCILFYSSLASAMEASSRPKSQQRGVQQTSPQIKDAILSAMESYDPSAETKGLHSMVKCVLLVSSWPSGKLPFKCPKIARKLSFFSFKKCHFFLKIAKNCNFFKNFQIKIV